MIRPYSSISGIPVARNRLVVANYAARNVAWYSQILTPPDGCYQALLIVYLLEAPTAGNELRVVLIGHNESMATDDLWTNPSVGAQSLHEPVTLTQYGQAILISPHVTDGGPGTFRLWTRRGVVDRRFRIWWYYAGAGGVSYTYGAALHYIY